MNWERTEANIEADLRELAGLPPKANGPQQAGSREGRATPDSDPDRSSTQEYPGGTVVRVEDMGSLQRAYAEAMHEDCEDGPPHPLSAHSPWSGGDLDGTEPWPAFMARLARHSLYLGLSPAYAAGHRDGLACEANGFGGQLDECEHVGRIRWGINR